MGALCDCVQVTTIEMQWNSITIAHCEWLCWVHSNSTLYSDAPSTVTVTEFVFCELKMKKKKEIYFLDVDEFRCNFLKST